MTITPKAFSTSHKELSKRSSLSLSLLVTTLDGVAIFVNFIGRCERSSGIKGRFVSLWRSLSKYSRR